MPDLYTGKNYHPHSQIGVGEDGEQRGMKTDVHTITYHQCRNGILNKSGKNSSGLGGKTRRERKGGNQ